MILMILLINAIMIIIFQWDQVRGDLTILVIIPNFIQTYLEILSNLVNFR